MYLEFSKITIENFKTFIDAPLTLKLTYAQPGLRFIRGRNEDEPELGSNGAAKSSLFDALSWCLFGQTVDGLRTPDIIPWSGAGDPYVTVTLYKDNTKHTIARATKPNQLLIDSKETGQTEIEQLLGFNFEVFKHTMLFGQGQPLFFDLAPKAKMEVFAAALDLNRWETRSEAASEQAKKLGVELQQVRSDISAEEAVLAETKNLLKENKKRIDEWEDERKDRAKELKQTLAELNVKFTKLAKIQYTADLALDSAGTELKALAARVAKLVDAKIAAQSEYNKAELVVGGFKDVCKSLTQELANLGKSDQCPTCGQSIKGTSLGRHKRGLEDRLRTLQAKIKAGIPAKVAQTLEDVTQALAQARQHTLAFNEKADKAQSTLNTTGPEVVQIQTQMKELRKQQKERDEESNPHRDQAQTLRRKISQIELELDKLDKLANQLEQKQLRTVFWVKGFKAVRLYLLEELLQELELVTNAILPESGLRNWQIIYSLEKETKKGTVIHGLNVSVLSPNNKKPVRWESWSGGERHRLRLVGALALSEVLLNHAGISTNLEVLDEPTRDLSVEGVQDLCEFLASRAQQLDKDIFLTGHNVIESAQFSDTITVVKEKGASSYIEKN